MALRYYRGSESSRETIEYDIKKGGRYITTCAKKEELSNTRDTRLILWLTICFTE